MPVRGIAAQARPHEIGSGPSPQGVQGEDCAVFLSWIEKCRKYGLENCDDQLQGLQTGRKTLQQVLQEQEQLIVDITQKYKEAVAHHTDAEGHYIKGEDEDDYSLDFHSPCTQGIQGNDCDQFKLWLEKCHEFGFMECMEELQGVQRQTMDNVFAEHDMLLRKVFEQHQAQQKRKFSTSSSARATTPAGDPKVRTGEPGDTPDSQSTQVTQVTQTQKLKRAVKEYGATVIVFHVGLSLASLGGFYLAVSRYFLAQVKVVSTAAAPCSLYCSLFVWFHRICGSLFFFFLHATFVVCVVHVRIVERVLVNVFRGWFILAGNIDRKTLFMDHISLIQFPL